MKDRLLERFLRYVSIDTQSDPSSSSNPSTPNQTLLANMLADELLQMGLTDARVDEHGYVMATLPANTTKKTPVAGFIAHLDTSPDMTAQHLRPVIHKHYDGNDLVLHAEKNIVMRVADFPVLEKYKGHTLITSDGTTLLGADNKAGVAEIMTAVEYLINNPDFRHGAVKIAFTPDEEIGRGADHFNIKRFAADFAFTVDGGEAGELQYENFNAAHARITIKGRNIHPGEAKDKMINASLLAMEYNRMLPENERPEHTSGYEGFFHLISISGNVEEAVMEYIVRDHDMTRFNNRKSKLRHHALLLNERYGSGRFLVEIKDQYYNMYSRIHPVIGIVELARKAMEALDITPLIRPVRGGTDGARLSYMGLPCPNLFAGGHNYHGRYEFIPLESMEKATRVILKIIELTGKSKL